MFSQLELLLLVALAIFAVSCYRLKLGVFLVCALLPAYLIRTTIFGVPTTLLELAIYAIAIAWLLRTLVERRKTKVEHPSIVYRLSSLPLKFPILLILLAAAIGVIISPDKNAALGIFKAYFFDPILFFVVLINLGYLENLGNFGKENFQPKSYKLSPISYLLAGLAVAGLAVAGATITQALTGGAVGGRVQAFYNTPNAVGLFLGPLVVLFGGLGLGYLGLRLFESIDSERYLGNLGIQKKKKFLPTAHFLLATIFLVAVLLSQSRGAILGIAGGAVFLVCVIFWQKKKILLGLLGALGLLGLLGAWALAPRLANLMDTGGGNERLAIWQGTWNMLLHHPIFGAGLAGFTDIYNNYKLASQVSSPLYPHNIILNFWSELGLLGLFGVLGLFVSVLKKPFAICHKPLAITMKATLIVILVHGLVDVPYFKNDLSVLFWIVIALSVFGKTDKMQS